MGEVSSEDAEWSALVEGMFERLDDERQARVDNLSERVGQLDDLISSLDNDLVEVCYDAVVDALASMRSEVEGTERELLELSLLSRIRDGDTTNAEDAESDLVQVPQLELGDLFVDDDDDEDGYEALESVLYERVGLAGRHLYGCAEAVRDTLESAATAVEAGATGAALRARNHALDLMGVAEDGFGVWCETLEGVLSQTGSYPGIAGAQVDAFMTWLRATTDPLPE